MLCARSFLGGKGLHKCAAFFLAQGYSCQGETPLPFAIRGVSYAVRARCGALGPEKNTQKSGVFLLGAVFVVDTQCTRCAGIHLRRNTGLYRGACRAVTYKELGAPECPRFQILHTQCCAKKSAAFAGGRPFPLQAWLGLLCQGCLACLCAPLGPGIRGGGCSPKRKCLMRKPQLVSSRLGWASLVWPFVL